MKTNTLDFPYRARTVYTAVKGLFRQQTGFSSVKCDDALFIVRARHGALLSPFSEKICIKVVATGSQTCRVVIESSSRSVLNHLNFGANKGNVSNLGDAISNRVFRLCQPGEIPMRK